MTSILTVTLTVAKHSNTNNNKNNEKYKNNNSSTESSRTNQRKTRCVALAMHRHMAECDGFFYGVPEKLTSGLFHLNLQRVVLDPTPICFVS